MARRGRALLAIRTRPARPSRDRRRAAVRWPGRSARDPRRKRDHDAEDDDARAAALRRRRRTTFSAPGRAAKGVEKLSHGHPRAVSVGFADRRSAQGARCRERRVRGADGIPRARRPHAVRRAQRITASVAAASAGVAAWVEHRRIGRVGSARGGRAVAAMGRWALHTACGRAIRLGCGSHGIRLLARGAHERGRDRRHSQRVPPAGGSTGTISRSTAAPRCTPSTRRRTRPSSGRRFPHR